MKSAYAAAMLAVLSATAFAQTPPTQPAAAAPATVKPAASPRTYLTLRADEDWRWLKNTPADQDPFDPIKYIPLDPAKDWSLTLGGSARFRFEYKINPAFGATNAASPTANDDYFMHRYYLHADLRYRDSFRIFVEGKAGFIDGEKRNPPPTPQPADHVDLHQAFIDMSPCKEFTLRLGRQELLYDKQKLVGPLDWANVRRSFDGAKLMMKFDQTKIDAFWARPVVIDNDRFDQPDDNTNFAGLYATTPLHKDHQMALFTYYLNRNRDTRTTFGPEYNADLKAGNTDRVTLGARFWGKFDAWDYDIEGGPQVGQLAGDDILAGYVSAEVGYTFADAWAKPRVSVGYDYASGDNIPGDGQNNTFDQLFPTGHLWFGYVDILGRQNINAGNITLTIQPTKELKIWASYHLFCLADSNDAAYNAAGAPFRRSTSGTAGMSLGHEFDITASYQLDRHTSFLFGYGWFIPANFVDNTGPSKDVHFLYTGVEYRF